MQKLVWNPSTSYRHITISIFFVLVGHETSNVGVTITYLMQKLLNNIKKSLHNITLWWFLLEPIYCKKWKKKPCQETGMGYRERLKVLMKTNWSKMTISDPLINLESIWYHVESLEVPYSPNQFLDRDLFFAPSYSKAALDAHAVSC